MGAFLFIILFKFLYTLFKELGTDRTMVHKMFSLYIFLALFCNTCQSVLSVFKSVP